MRGVAASMVVLYHALRSRPYVAVPGLAGEAIAFVLSWGFAGVYLFFVISGFCIHLRWATQAHKGKRPHVDFLAFWRRRIRRLYPAYLAAFAVYFALNWAQHTLPPGRALATDVGLHLVMFHNVLASTTWTFNGVFWTLAVEEQLYLAYFVLLALRSRYPWHVVLGVTLLARVACYAAGFAVGFETRFSIGESAFAAWFPWALGALAVEAFVGVARVPALLRSRAAAGALVAAAVAANWLQRSGPPRGWRFDALLVLAQPLWGVAFFVLLNAVVAAERTLASRPLALAFARLGLFSYSLYLTHELFLSYLVTYLAQRLGWSADRTTLLAIVLFTPLSLVFARVFFQIFERPFMSAPRHIDVPEPALGRP